uniref:WD repeat domain 21 n=1 Tax=Nothobranchius korthausae TaxID=1143690 RepID=A0A1A8GEN5_9TELE
MKKRNWPQSRRYGRYRNDRERSAGDEQYGLDDAGPSHRASTCTSSSSSSTSSVAPELPGFYFDPEKNRYFRLLPGHNNCNPLTMEQLREKEREKKRHKMLAEDENPRKKSPKPGLNTSLLLQKRHLGILPERSYSRLIHEVKVSGMRRHKLEIQSTDSSNDSNTDNFRLIVGDSACERVFTVNDVSHGGCKYGIMNFSSSSQGSLSVEMCDNLYFTNRRVNSICWASVNYPDSHVLLCLVGAADTPGCVLTFKEQVTPVRVLQDENYLLAADMLGQIKLWDVRVTKPVQEYKGHHNEHAYLPLHVNEPEGLLFAVGQDCYTRIWSLTDGHLLRTIPSPHPAANDMIPSVVFSSNLGGCRGLPGLLMAVKHDLYYFPYNTDYQESSKRDDGSP